MRLLIVSLCLLFGGCMGFEDLQDRLSIIDLKKPETMTSDERQKYVHGAYDRSGSGVMVTIPANGQLVLPPGTYQWLPVSLGAVLQYTNPATTTTWQLGFGGTFSLVTPQTINEVGGVACVLQYFPDRMGPGVPLMRQFIGTGASRTISFPNSGAWSVVETNAANQLVNNIIGAGNAEFLYLIPAGHTVTMSQTSLL